MQEFIRGISNNCLLKYCNSKGLSRMKIRVAESAGFCFGVRRAMELAAKSAPAFTLGPLIHNRDAVEELAHEGVCPVDGEENIPEGGRVVIRSHGVGRREMEFLSRKGCQVTDATCPFVKRIHVMAQEASAAGSQLIVVGNGTHPEVLGVLGWSDGPAYAVSSAAEAERLPQL